jgi:formylglycine-generating enzyme required for sulfatase activity
MKSDPHVFNTSYPTSILKKVGINHMEILPKTVTSLFYHSIIEFDKENYILSVQLLYQSYCHILLNELNPMKEITTDDISKSLLEYSEILKSNRIFIDDSIVHKFNQITYTLEDPSPDSEVLVNCLNDAKFIFEYYIESYKSKNIDQKVPLQEKNQSQVIEDKKKTKSTVISKNFTNSIKMEFSLIPPGEFVMGALPTDKDANDDETPIHKVRITKSFYISKFLTTQGNWKSIMNNNPSFFKKLGDDNPIERVSWYLIQDFIKRLNEKEKLQPKEGYRLPTEAEWEYVCKAGSSTKYYHSNKSDLLEEYAWFSYTSNRSTQVVGTKKPNAFGIYDMLGNVREWCHDWYDPKYYQKSPVNDPQGPTKGEFKTMRGGSWYCVPRLTRTTQRYHHIPSSKSFLIGFRLVKQT